MGRLADVGAVGRNQIQHSASAQRATVGAVAGALQDFTWPLCATAESPVSRLGIIRAGAAARCAPPRAVDVD